MEKPVFNSAVIGTEPLTNGTFSIDWATIYNTWDEDEDDPTVTSFLAASSDITISGTNVNPLYDVISETPLNLQGMLATVVFGIETRFIEITKIGYYKKDEEKKVIYLDSTTFCFLTNLEYMEKLHLYKSRHFKL